MRLDSETGFSATAWEVQVRSWSRLGAFRHLFGNVLDGPKFWVASGRPRAAYGSVFSALNSVLLLVKGIKRSFFLAFPRTTPCKLCVKNCGAGCVKTRIVRL